MIFIAAKGFFLGASLIIAIGMQNAFVLRQGLKNRYVFLSALTPSLTDTALIAAGVLGFGTLIDAMPGLLFWIRWGGAVFLAAYGIKSLLSARKTETLKAANLPEEKKNGAGATVLILLGVSLLNPHVYLDTVVLVGGLAAASYGDKGRYIFGLGAACASFCWFFALAYGGRLLAPVFAKPRAWQILDILIGLTMFVIAFSLII